MNKLIAAVTMALGFAVSAQAHEGASAPTRSPSSVNESAPTQNHEAFQQDSARKRSGDRGASSAKGGAGVGASGAAGVRVPSSVNESAPTSNHEQFMQDNAARRNGR